MLKRRAEEPGAAGEQCKRDEVEGNVREMCNLRTLAALIGFKGTGNQGMPVVPRS